MISQRERGELARFYTVTDPKKHKKGYTVYKVTARIISRKNPEDIQEITVWKRYSDFRKLHRDLWQIHRNVYRQPELFPPFAKAKVFGRFDESVIEERRQCSEDLLQFSANIPALYGSQHIQDFFKDGEVQDGSELIGPAEPFSDFLADSLSDSSSDVLKDIGGVEDLTGLAQPEHGGPPSDGNLSSPWPHGDPLAHPDDGMASGGGWDAGAELEPGRAGLFPTRLRTADYLEQASQQIGLALQKEAEEDFSSALEYYRSGVDLLLQGVQGEVNPSRREAVKRRTFEYLTRAELISSTHLKDAGGQSAAHNQTLAAQCCKGSWGQQSQADELHNYRVLGVIDKVLLVIDKRTQETLVLKGLRKSSECGGVKKTIVPRAIPNMVRLRKFIVSDDSIFLLLEYVEGGKLWSHITKYLRSSSPDDSFDIPFMQTTQVAAKPQTGPLDDGTDPHPAGGATLAVPPPLEARGAPLSDSADTSEDECTDSYLTLCNEYEQEKAEPVALGEEEAEEDPHGPGGGALRSPITAQELCLFAEGAEPAALGSEAVDATEDPPEVGEVAEVAEVEGRATDLWRFDGDRGSNESVPVISFKEATAEDEGRPPDLLVNLPGVGGVAGVTVDALKEELAAAGVAFAAEATPSPKFGKPDVLQLGEEVGLDLSVEGDIPAAPASFDQSGVKVPKGRAPPARSETGSASISSLPAPLLADSDPALWAEPHPGAGSEVAGGRGRSVAELFRELDVLAEVAMHTRIPETLVRTWAMDILLTLDALHQEGIVCKDLNPRNLLLDHRGHVELTYFCSWSEVEESCDPNAVAKMYCAPEVGGISEETAACDWWSLGALLFELLTGKCLHQCHPGGISKHTALNVPEFLSEEARSLLEQLLQYNPAERLGTGGAGVEDIKSHPFFALVNWPK
ncbi:ribosomal protein S6 kinase delta-1 isoform X6 [Electrophorus electricus]|uniref:ribosomal protein S6 kinase delta-1 isoform X6 n=1 Tax=Electrophorus electricus TaxID=8005 RepID=UPI0015CFF6B2|nr:ribosomal protein S6 kinase delta-1 isoform X6 [Electrophorus electricus]